MSNNTMVNFSNPIQAKNESEWVERMLEVGFEREAGELRFSIDCEHLEEGLEQANQLIEQYGLGDIAYIRESDDSDSGVIGDGLWFVIDVVVEMESLAA